MVESFEGLHAALPKSLCSHEAAAQEEGAPPLLGSTGGSLGTSALKDGALLWEHAAVSE